MHTHNVVNMNNLKHISYCVVSLSLFGIKLRMWAQISGVHLFKMQLHRRALIFVIKQKNVYSTCVQHAAKTMPSNTTKGGCCIVFS